MSSVIKEFAQTNDQAKNEVIQTTANGIIDFTEGNPFSEGSF